PVEPAPVEPAPVEPAPVEPAPVESAPVPSDATFDDDEELGARDMPAPARTATPVPAPAPEPEPERAPEPAMPPTGKVRRRTRFTLVVIREDMSDGERYALDEGIFTVGREGTSVEFPEDVYLDPFHTSLDVTERGVTVVDQGSVNGTFWRIDTPVVLEHGHEVRLGQQLLRLELLSEVGALSPSNDGTELLGGPVPSTTWGRLVEVVAPDYDGDTHLLDKTPIAIGREKGDVTFPADGYVSGRHARLTWDGAKARIEDLGSSNGTFARAYTPTALGVGARLLLGQQLFRIDG
ncbi:MAG: FHA domain-containing protein, partial [Myxococcales bacterium]|nr:FHA domain-containing protein [Myxococcales bacterium]